MKQELVILKPTPILTDSPIIVYIIPAKQEFLEYIEIHIKSSQHSIMGGPMGTTMGGGITDEKEYHVIVIPKMNNECNSFLAK